MFFNLRGRERLKAKAIYIVYQSVTVYISVMYKPLLLFVKLQLEGASSYIPKSIFALLSWKVWSVLSHQILELWQLQILVLIARQVLKLLMKSTINLLVTQIIFQVKS